MSSTPSTFGNRGVGSAVQDCPLRKAVQATSWISIKLVASAGKPVGWEEYLVTPNGDNVRGLVDAQGRARVEGLRMRTWIAATRKTAIVSRSRKSRVRKAASEAKTGSATAVWKDTYNVLPTTGDGNCLFRAVSRVLHDTEDNHLALRQEAVGRIRAKPLVYTDELLSMSSLTPFTDRGTYLDGMNQAAANAGDVKRWGGHPELAALSAIKNRPIWIHSSDAATEARGCTKILGDSDNAADGEPIHVLYEGGNHYIAMTV
jgi:hypothetical protein